MPQFFIDRPIFAWVVALFILLAGALAIPQLPVAQYPNVAPPQVEVYAVYPGASAQTMDESVVSVIEQELNGADNLLYFESQSSLGSATITATFEPGTVPDLAQVDVQNRLKVVESRLPRPVTQQGLQVEKVSTGFLLLGTLTSEDGSYDEIALSDLLARNVMNEIRRLKGVGKAQLYGSERAMRIWIDPAKLVGFKLTPQDVADAIAAQNAQVAPGSIGDLPARATQEITANVVVKGQLSTPEEFAAIVLRANPDGSVVTVGDVARVEIGAQEYQYGTRLNGKPTSAFSVKLSPGANAMETATLVRQKMDELARYFPAGVKYDIPYDTSPFVKVSIQQVISTLFEAMLLVFAVMFVFLQNIRYTLIPTLVVPVALMGTFAVMLALGFSVNVLTLFGMVLAIGILVDDAIVVVENVERVMSEEGLSPKEATRKSMAEITPALVGIALTLSAVFIPMAFFGGSTGVIYRQFSITIVSAMVLSVLVALTLTPALCATLLKPIPKGAHSPHGAAPRRGLMGLTDRFFDGFNRRFDRTADGYQRGVGRVVRRGGRMMVVYALIVGGMAVLFMRLPTSFLPNEDQGAVQIQITLPAGSSNTRLQAVMAEVQKYFAAQPDVVSFNSITGANGDQSSARGFVRLTDWSQRTRPEQSADAIARKATRDLRQIRDARIFVVLPPAVRGLGANAGFNFQLKDLNGLGHEALVAARDKVLELARGRHEISNLRFNNADDTSQLGVTIDDAKAGALGLATTDINSTLSSAIGGTYVNDFLNKGRVKRVYMQGDAPFRMLPQDIGPWTVRNNQGQMVPFSAFSSTYWTYGSPQLQRYNGSSSYEFVGDAAPGVSSGAAMAAVEDIMKQMPPGIGYEWTGASFQERLSGSQAPALYAISILFVFLCLAALYESWSVPFSVILVVPLGIVGALLGIGIRGLSNDVYFQVGLLTTVGLACKNAILIVE
ncbi:efflux RND transporter permease subunit, partial [uncultured Pseudomonas sp.]|uniref:efflux RND transporter permease subunit n=1 Tax=uncultured Pseudomonas sp. TaxID=114707 RepID=UPI00258F60D7